jgi:hypothetical protein
MVTHISNVVHIPQSMSFTDCSSTTEKEWVCNTTAETLRPSPYTLAVDTRALLVTTNQAKHEDYQTVHTCITQGVKNLSGEKPERLLLWRGHKEAAVMKASWPGSQQRRRGPRWCSGRHSAPHRPPHLALGSAIRL